MNPRLTFWVETHRNQITNGLTMIGWLLSILITLTKRMLSGAVLILLYFFFTASPDTTVYQLAQIPHQPNFWPAAVSLAVVYSFVRLLANGGSVRTPRTVGAATMIRGASSIKSPR